MRWSKKDFLSKAFENNCLFLGAFLTSLSPLTLISPLASFLGTLVNVNSYFLIQLGTICLTSPLAPPPGSGPAFCVILCVHLRFSWLLFMSVYFLHAPYIPRASLSFPFRACSPLPSLFLLLSASPSISPLLFPHFVYHLCLCSPFPNPGWASHLSCLPLLPTGSPRTPQVSPPPRPKDSSTVTPATLPNPATRFPPSVRMVKFVASVLVPQVGGLWSDGRSLGLPHSHPSRLSWDPLSPCLLPA